MFCLPYQVEIDSGSGSSDEEGWVDLPHSSDEDDAGPDDEVDDEEDEEHEDDSEGEWETEGENESTDVSGDETMDTTTEKDAENSARKRKILKAKRTVNSEEKSKKRELAKQVVLDRILTDEDFKRIEMANIKKQVQAAKKGAKRKAEEEFKESRPSELVKLGDIENIYKKRKHDKQSRMESVKRGQEDREKFGYKDGRMNIHCSKTNREKRKNKNFLMLKHKAKGKIKRSFKDKQIALRNHLIKQKRMK